jgi:signal transduction histidine kinase
MTEDQRLGEDLVFLRRLLQDLTHEIAAPLTPLFGHLDLLELRSKDTLTPMQQRCMAAMRRSLRRLSAINDRMLELARIERGHIPCEPTDVDARQLLAEAQRRVGKTAEEHGVRVRADLGEGPPPHIRVDWNLALLALDHLLQNALRLAPRDTEVTLALRIEPPSCALIVSDHGRAVPAEELPKLIRPFYRVVGDESYTETAGLGLTIVSLIATRLDGRLDLAHTQPGDDLHPGLTATLRVPLSTPTA